MQRRLETGLNWITAALFIIADMAGGGVVAIPIALLNSGNFNLYIFLKNNYFKKFFRSFSWLTFYFIYWNSFLLYCTSSWESKYFLIVKTLRQLL